MKQIKWFDQFIHVAIQAVSNALLVIILVCVFTEVVSRYIFAQSHGFMEELSKWAQVWIAYLMLGIVEKSRAHIKVDILVNALPKRQKKVLFVFFDLITIGFSVFLFLSGFASAMNIKMLGSLSSSGIAVPLWIPMISSCIGAVLLGYFGLSNLLSNLLTSEQGRQQ